MVDVHMDPQVLAGLQEVMEGEYPQLLDTFLHDSEERVKALHMAGGDTQALRQIAHSFKGSSGNLGAVQLALLCQELEMASAGDIGGLVDQIDREFALVRAMYKRELQRFFAG